MIAIAYIRGFVPILWQFGDIAAARRSGHLHMVIACKRNAARAALKGRK